MVAVVLVDRMAVVVRQNIADLLLDLQIKSIRYYLSFSAMRD